MDASDEEVRARITGICLTFVLTAVVRRRATV